MTPEAKAREQCANTPTETGSADCVLFINRNAVGVIEAK